jgi:uncharacterized membrane protein
MGTGSNSPLEEVEADVVKARIRFAGLPDSFWLMTLLLVVLLFAAGIRIGGVNVPLGRIPWSVLVPCMALFCFVHSYIMLGLHRALTLLGLATSIAFCAEYYGESTGILFGPYCYTDVLGPKILGRVPMLIPFAWYMMFYPSYVVTNILTETRPVSKRRETTWIVWLSLLSALIMTAWDITMDPVMSFYPGGGSTDWCNARGLHEATLGHPAWVWKEGGVHFGVPLQNYAGWMATAFVVFLIYRLLERRIAQRPLQGYNSRFMAWLPVAAYGMMALIDAWLGYPEIEDIHLISPFVMGIPFLFATFKLFAERTDLPLWPTLHKFDQDA